MRFFYEGWSKSPGNHLFFSSHWCIYTKMVVGNVYIKYEPLSVIPPNMVSIAHLVALQY